MQRFSAAIVGGGAAGILAAISAKRLGKPVVICERLPRIGKKILASGNGRCNLLNEDLDESHYNVPARPLAKAVFSRFGKKEIRGLFKEIGLEVYSEDNRIFPVTNQSASVLKVLEIELGRLSVPVELNFEVADISESRGHFVLTSRSGNKIACESVIIAGGGRTYPALGSDGSSYKLAEHLGHKIIGPVPAAVPIVVRDRLCHMCQGQKIFAKASSVIGGAITDEASGEILFTRYGLSGTSILDISEGISIAVNRHKKKGVFVSLDMVPFMSEDELRGVISKKFRNKFSDENLLAGILPNKLCAAFKELFRTKDPFAIAKRLKQKTFAVAGTRGWNEADFTAGGVRTDEIDEATLESRLRKGVFFAGEVLDVNGERGGYNLAWAWASGFVAGLNA